MRSDDGPEGPEGTRPHTPLFRRRDRPQGGGGAGPQQGRPAAPLSSGRRKAAIRDGGDTPMTVPALAGVRPG